MHWWNGSWHMGGMVFWWALGLAAIALVIWAVLQAGRPRVADGPAGDSPEAILKRRYARGEIDRETYERMLADVRR